MFNLNKLRWPYREDGLFSALSFIVFFVPLVFTLFTNENFETPKFALWLGFFGLALLLRVFSAQAKNREIRFNKMAVVLAGGLVAWALLAALLAPDRLYGFFGSYYRFTNGFVFLSLWALTVLLLVDVLDRQKWVFLLKILCFDAVLVALKSLAEGLGYTLYLGATPQEFFRAAPSFLGNPNFSSMFMACVLPFLVLFWRKASGFAWQVIYGLAIFAVIFSLLILTSRGALLALAFGIVFFLALLLAGKKRGGLLKSAAIIFLALVMTLLVAEVSRPGIFHFSASDVNVSFRLEVWRESALSVLRHPWFGIGLGNFALFHERLVRPLNMGVFDDPHNLWIFLAVTGGLPLLLLFVGLVTAPVRRAFWAWRAEADGLALAGLCALAIFAVAAAFTPVSLPQFLFLAVLAGGMFAAFGLKLRSCRLTLPGRAATALAGIFFIASGLGLILGESALHFAYGDYTAGNYPRALKLFNLSKFANPTDSLSYVFAAQSEARLFGDSQKTETDLAAFQKIHPLQANTYVELANVYFGLYLSSKNPRLLDQAIVNLNKSLAIDREFPERWGELGMYYFFKNDLSQALSLEQKSLEQKPGMFASLVMEAKIYQKLGNRQAMLDALGQAYLQNPTDEKMKFLLYVAKQSQDINQVPLNIIFAEPQ